MRVSTVHKSMKIRKPLIPAIQAIAVFALLFFSAQVRLWACSCRGPDLCDPRYFADSDFIGEVLWKIPVPSVGEDSHGYMSVRMRVIESFRGSQKIGDSVTVHTGFGGGDCGFPFKVGGRYLIDAWNREGKMSTGICNRTTSLERGQADIRILRLIAAHQPLPQLAGELSVASGPHGESSHPLAGVGVTLRSENGTAASTVVADAGGYFQFDGVPQGRYRLTLNLPRTLSVNYTSFSERNEDESPTLPVIEINAPPGTACRALIMVASSAEISGRIQFPGGKVVEGWATASTVTPDGKPWDSVLSAEPHPDGSFRLAHLWPGRYSIEFTRKDGSATSLPQIIELKEGEQKSNIVLIAK